MEGDTAKERREKEKLSPGDVMKAVIRPGDGSSTPKKGDLIIFHHTTRTSAGVVVESTRREHGGTGMSKRLVLGKSKMIQGWEEGIPTMSKGEVAMFKVKPEFHYGDTKYQETVPDSYPKNEELMFEVELMDFFAVKVVADDLGVLKRILIEGEGWETPRQPYEVRLWLRWRMSADEEFVPLQKDEPFHFTLGQKEVPTGLELGISTMTRKEKSLIYVCGAHLTDASSIPNLPTDVEEIQFEVEIVQIIQVRDVVGDGRVVKRRIQDGRGEFPMDCPLQDCVLRIHYKGYLPRAGGLIFFDSRKDNEGGEPVVFGSDEGLVPEGLEMCVKLMLPGEIALVSSTSEYAYDKFKRPDLVPEGADVQWEVELLDFEKAKDWTGLTFQEIMNDADKIKAIGNRLFKEDKYNLAKAKYEKVLREFNHVNPQDEEETDTFLQSRYLLHLNVAACYQKLGDHVKAIESCNKVLEESPNHVKALYRRGMSHMAVADFDDARADFNAMLTIDNAVEADVKAALAKLRKKQQEAEVNARKQFKGLFDKKPGELSKVDEEETKEQVVTGESSRELNADATTDGSSKNKEKVEQTSSSWLSWRYWLRGFPTTKCTIL
ncbi:hypothetical protein GOP47_0006376 [Adiantum capillus-veneris]|uniref:peptidylprolyl isomerase n=1 Tax=Adiantum capillus-veneris TaxID=13818 RepID=A0A9D4V2R9_ADICA|nr:hypothetical protein GOP47_0006376 [Adiantum capillus-veneris]